MACCIPFNESVTPLLVITGIDAEYQWSCSPLGTANNRYILPDLGIRNHDDVANNAANLLPSDTTVVYIFPLPSTLNCNGTVSAMQYCYIDWLNLGTEQLIFTLLILEQNGLTFTINDVAMVTSMQRRRICTRRFDIENFFQSGTYEYCCDTLLLDMHQFALPVQNFAFGIIPVSILGYHPSITANNRFLVEHYRFSTSVIGTPAVGNMFTLVEANRATDRSLKLLQ